MMAPLNPTLRPNSRGGSTATPLSAAGWSKQGSWLWTEMAHFGDSQSGSQNTVAFTKYGSLDT